MSFLLEIPLVVSLAEWIWNDSTSQDSSLEQVKTSAELCLSTLPLMNTDCWKCLIAKGLGILIIVGAFLNKAPVIRNIVVAQATAGLSRASVYGETIIYANAAVYGLLNSHPFSAYGENIALLLQAILIVVLTWHYDSKYISAFERGVVLAMAALYWAVVVFFLPQQYYFVLMTSIMPLLLYARGSQIIETFRCQHTGAQSIITTTMNLGGGLIRILTTIQEVGWDFAVLVTFGLSLVLNIICFGQYFYYQKNTQTFLADLQTASKKKKQM